MGDDNYTTKPILKWAGGKKSLLPQLLRKFPSRFNRYFEPFLGGGAVFLALQPNRRSFLNDVNPELIRLYEVVRDEPMKLIHALDEYSRRYSESFYYELRAKTPRDPVKKAARTIFLNKTGFNGLYRQNLKGHFNVPFGKREKCPALYHRENLLKVSQLLAKAKLHNVDFETLIDRAKEGDFVYCDPPYEPLTTTASFNRYVGKFGRDEQVRLKAACDRAARRGAYVVISNSNAHFIRTLYRDWKRSIVMAKRAINSKGDRRFEIKELCLTSK